MKKKERVFKIKIRDKKTGEENFIIMGDSYKSFEEHFLNVVGMFTERWDYDDSPEGKGRCLGRILDKEFLEIHEAKTKFVSFGGLKMAYVEYYDKRVEEHNRSGDYEACKYLKDIAFNLLDKNYLHQLLRNCQVRETEMKCCSNCHWVCLVANRVFCGNPEIKNKDSEFYKNIKEWDVQVCDLWKEPKHLAIIQRVNLKRKKNG